MNTLLLALLAFLIVVYLASQDWRRAIRVVLVLVVVEGALRKWVLPGASQLVYFLKDFVLLGAYLRFFLLDKKYPRLVNRNSILLFLLGINCLWMLTQAVNPSLGSPIIGILGLKNYLFYVPLIWMVPQMFQNEQEMKDFLSHYLLLLIPVGLLAIAQFFSPIDSPLNVYAWGDEGPDVAVNGDLRTVRVTGTFSYLAGYATYLGVCLALLIPLLTIQQPRFWKWASIGSFLMLAITTFMTGSRTLVFSNILIFLGYFLIVGLTNFRSFSRSLKFLLVPALLAFALATWGFSDAVDAFTLRVTQTSDLPERISSSFLEPFRFASLKGIDGYGAGSTFQASAVVRGILSLPEGEQIPVFFESEMGRITLELGFFGFFLWYGLKLMLLLAMWQTYRKLQSPLLHQIALSIFLFQTISFNFLVVFNHTANLFYWFLNGFIFLLPQLEKRASLQQDSQLFPNYVPTSFPGSSHQ
jgi:hypothetical protein